MISRRSVILGFLGGGALLALPAAAGETAARWLSSSRRLQRSVVEYSMVHKAWVVAWLYEGFPGEPGPLYVAAAVDSDMEAGALAERAPLRFSGGPHAIEARMLEARDAVTS